MSSKARLKHKIGVFLPAVSTAASRTLKVLRIPYSVAEIHRDCFPHAANKRPRDGETSEQAFGKRPWILNTQAEILVHFPEHRSFSQLIT